MKKSLLALDYYLQALLIIPLLCAFPLLLPLMLLIPLGALQVSSAAIKGFAMNNYVYRVFALVAGIYGFGLMWYLQEDGTILHEMIAIIPDNYQTLLGVLAYLIIPVISAVYYFLKSQKDYREAIAEAHALKKQEIV